MSGAILALNLLSLTEQDAMQGERTRAIAERMLAIGERTGERVAVEDGGHVLALALLDGPVPTDEAIATCERLAATTPGARTRHPAAVPLRVARSQVRVRSGAPDPRGRRSGGCTAGQCDARRTSGGRRRDRDARRPMGRRGGGFTAASAGADRLGGEVGARWYRRPPRRGATRAGSRARGAGRGGGGSGASRATGPTTTRRGGAAPWRVSKPVTATPNSPYPSRLRHLR